MSNLVRIVILLVIGVAVVACLAISSDAFWEYCINSTIGLLLICGVLTLIEAIIHTVRGTERAIKYEFHERLLQNLFGVGPVLVIFALIVVFVFHTTLMVGVTVSLLMGIVFSLVLIYISFIVE